MKAGSVWGVVVVVVMFRSGGWGGEPLATTAARPQLPNWLEAIMSEQVTAVFTLTYRRCRAPCSHHPNPDPPPSHHFCFFSFQEWAKKFPSGRTPELNARTTVCVRRRRNNLRKWPTPNTWMLLFVHVWSRKQRKQFPMCNLSSAGWKQSRDSWEAAALRRETRLFPAVAALQRWSFPLDNSVLLLQVQPIRQRDRLCCLGNRGKCKSWILWRGRHRWEDDLSFYNPMQP